jgi:radical SAM protein with 4Fe4S-binding SPASM domain
MRLMSQADVGTITFTGGEPLMAERFLELVLACRMRRRAVTIISNGNAGSPETYDTLVAMGVQRFQIPLLSPTPSIHDELTRRDGSWSRARESIEHLVAKSAMVTGVIVLTAMNRMVVGSTMAMLASLGVHHLMVNRFNIGGTGIGEAARLVLTRRELRESMLTVNARAQSLGIPVSSNVSVPHCVVEPREVRFIQLTSCGTCARDKPLTLDAGGDLRLCNHSPVVLGNIARSTIGELIGSPYVARFHGTVPEPCRACRLYGECRGGCRAAAEQLGLPLEAGDPVLAGG